MGQGDERNAQGGRKSRLKRRVTLKFDSPPLLLPGEDDPLAGPVTRETADLSLPTEAEAEARRSTIPPIRESGEGEDAWARQRPIPSPRKPTTVPPPPGGGDGGVLDLVDKRSRPSSPTIDLTAEMVDRYALGDYTAALRIAELILGRDAHHDPAERIAKSCKERLVQLYLSRLGSLTRVPHVAVDASEVRWLGLDHRAAFLLTRVDGLQCLSDVLDVSGMGRLEALKTLVELLDMGAIGFSD